MLGVAKLNFIAKFSKETPAYGVFLWRGFYLLSDIFSGTVQSFRKSLMSTQGGSYLATRTTMKSNAIAQPWMQKFFHIDDQRALTQGLGTTAVVLSGKTTTGSKDFIAKKTFFWVEH